MLKGLDNKKLLLTVGHSKYLDAQKPVQTNNPLIMMISSCSGFLVPGHNKNRGFFSILAWQ